VESRARKRSPKCRIAWYRIDFTQEPHKLLHRSSVRRKKPATCEIYKVMASGQLPYCSSILSLAFVGVSKVVDPVFGGFQVVHRQVAL
jgi:hypothetical protein